MFDFTFTTPISILISLAALAGVSVHDTKIDKLATSMVGVPAVVAATDNGSKVLSSDPHTHVEKVSLKDVSSQPRIMPRYGDQKKHMMQKNVPKGGHAFDGYVVPVV